MYSHWGSLSDAPKRVMGTSRLSSAFKSGGDLGFNPAPAHFRAFGQHRLTGRLECQRQDHIQTMIPYSNPVFTGNPGVWPWFGVIGCLWQTRAHADKPPTAVAIFGAHGRSPGGAVRQAGIVPGHTRWDNRPPRSTMPWVWRYVDTQVYGFLGSGMGSLRYLVRTDCTRTDDNALL